MTAPLHDLVLYTRAGCGLCDEAREVLRQLFEQRAALGLHTPMIVECDIAADPALERELFDRIPVVELAGRRLELTSSPAKLRHLLAQALDAPVVTVG